MPEIILRRNLIKNTELIKDPLRREKKSFGRFMEYFFALYEIAEKKIQKEKTKGLLEKKLLII